MYLNEMNAKIVSCLWIDSPLIFADLHFVVVIINYYYYQIVHTIYCFQIQGGAVKPHVSMKLIWCEHVWWVK
jgi:hypothetical protein